MGITLKTSARTHIMQIYYNVRSSLLDSIDQDGERVRNWDGNQAPGKNRRSNSKDGMENCSAIARCIWDSSQRNTHSYVAIFGITFIQIYSYSDSIQICFYMMRWRTGKLSLSYIYIYRVCTRRIIASRDYRIHFGSIRLSIYIYKYYKYYYI